MLPWFYGSIFYLQNSKDIFVTVAVQRIPIAEFIARMGGNLLIDVRSPGEYLHAHIPGAYSLPLFSDEERKIVGTTYKQQSREQAIKIGLDLFGPRMRKMVEEVEGQIRNTKYEIQYGVEENNVGNRMVFVYCWRGGMRSAAIAWLLDLYGFKVFTLAGGYKAYRNQVLQTFQQAYSFTILGGFTGSGKTEVLQELERTGQTVIDLEKLASHKGSAFGSYNMPPQPTQEMFENLLATDLWLKSNQFSQVPTNLVNENFLARPIWLEDESQRIGNLNIPIHLWNTMRNSPLVFMDIPFEERLHHITSEYGQWAPEKLIDSVQRIKQRLGGLEAKNAIAFLEDRNFTEAFRILLHYYDKRYLKGLHNREDVSALLTRISCTHVRPENALQITKQQPV
jgi:tRNA 2-selenouridine synthase